MPHPEAKMNESAGLSGYILLAYLLLGGASLAYFLLHVYGGGSIAGAAAQASINLEYGVTALIVAFGVIIIGLSLRGKG